MIVKYDLCFICLLPLGNVKIKYIYQKIVNDYEGVVVKLTEATLHRHNSSGGIYNKIDVWNKDYWEISSKSKSNPSSSTQVCFKLYKQSLFARD